MPENRSKSVAPAIAVLSTMLVSAMCASCPDPAVAVTANRLELLSQSVKVTDQSFVTGYGLRIHLAGGELNKGFAIVPAIEYWKDVDRVPDIGINEVLQRDWRFGADARYHLGDGVGWTPYFGAGMALHVVRSASNVTFAGQLPLVEEHSGRKLAPNLLVGVDMPHTGPIRNSIELDYDLVPDLKQFKINFGVGWVFGGGGDSE